MIRLENIHVRAGDFQLRDVSFDVPDNSYAVLMGKTGSGKTMLLEVITGLKPILAGRIVLGDVDVTDLKPAMRNIGYVPQDGALFTTMKVRDQLGFALDVRRVDARTIRRRVEELAEMLEISDLLARTTVGLSGGEQQRVALGRALAFGPSTLCLDEPLSALDQETREQTMALLKRVQRETGVTCLHVTHNEDEAEKLADTRIRIRDEGIVTVSQNGAPQSDGSHVPGGDQARGEGQRRVRPR